MLRPREVPDPGYVAGRAELSCYFWNLPTRRRYKQTVIAFALEVGPVQGPPWLRTSPTLVTLTPRAVLSCFRGLLRSERSPMRSTNPKRREGGREGGRGGTTEASCVGLKTPRLALGGRGGRKACQSAQLPGGRSGVASLPHHASAFPHRGHDENGNRGHLESEWQSRASGKLDESGHGGSIALFLRLPSVSARSPEHPNPTEHSV